ncbi:hypothetical protein CSW38_10045 [Thermus scotoductus]|uniref:Uncharacterized protein n=1 Tax=Thermus scotoductus TaxID=37636 RepID=A0A430RV15_THESC|nr:hypothetical protein CSW51_09735 [Thermus scotoductus]RTH01438.1 hypothetical protein CSW47_12440 [Thermus scotoductus]RTH23784.1 hypothetical protein CSW38_10045 [Thermus scotoductus]
MSPFLRRGFPLGLFAGGRGGHTPGGIRGFLDLSRFPGYPLFGVRHLVRPIGPPALPAFLPSACGFLLRLPTPFPGGV